MNMMPFFYLTSTNLAKTQHRTTEISFRESLIQKKGMVSCRGINNGFNSTSFLCECRMKGGTGKNANFPIVQVTT